MSETLKNNHEIYKLQSGVDRAAEIVSGQPGANPLEVFPDPRIKDRREDVDFDTQLDEHQEVAFRGVMAELGPGRESDLGASEVGLPAGYNAVLEGGQAHKMLAELDLVLNDPTLPRQVIITGSGDRIIPDKERELTASLLNLPVEEVGKTEFDVAQQVIQSLSTFSPIPDGLTTPLGGNPSVMNCEYDLTKNPDTMDMNHTHNDPGQLVGLGTLNGSIPVLAMRIDRFPDPEAPNDSTKYIQPSNAQKIGLSRAVLSAEDEIKYGFDAVRNIGLVTSSTYEPSSRLSALEAEDKMRKEQEDRNLKYGYNAAVLSYGIQTLARIKGTEPQKPALNQLAGEAHKIAQMLPDPTLEDYSSIRKLEVDDSEIERARALGFTLGSRTVDTKHPEQGVYTLWYDGSGIPYEGEPGVDF